MADDEFKGEFDFGFNLVDEDELEVVQQLQTQTADVTDAAKNIEKDLLQTDAKLNTLYNAILSTVEAADILNVSRPFLIKLLETNEIPFDLVGRHRRIRFEDLMAYKSQQTAARKNSLRKMSEIDQELGI